MGLTPPPVEGEPVHEQVAMTYFGVTIIALNGGDIDITHLTPLEFVLQELSLGQGVYVVGVERGPVQGHLHFQILKCSTHTSAAGVTNHLKQWVESVGAPYQVHARVINCPPRPLLTPLICPPRRLPRRAARGPRSAGAHKAAARRGAAHRPRHGGLLPEGQGKSHFLCAKSPLITPEYELLAQREYLIHGNLATKGRCALTPRNFLEKAHTFRVAQCLPDDIRVQTVLLLMLRSKLFYTSYSWITSHAGQVISIDRANECFRLLVDSVNVIFDDVADVFFAKRELGMWTYSDVTESLPITGLQLEAVGLRALAPRNLAVAGIIGDGGGGPDGASAGVSASATETAMLLAQQRNFNRVRDDETALREATRKRSRRVYEEGKRPQLEFHIGPTGSGKSRAVMQLYRDAYWWFPANGGNSVWLNGYNGEETIVFDEYYRGEVPFDLFKVLCGFTPCSFQVKGSADVQVLAKKFVFTSTDAPSTWYAFPAGEWARRVAEFGTIITYPRGAAGL